MNIIINNDTLTKYNLDIPQVLYLLSLAYGLPIKQSDIVDLKKKGFINYPPYIIDNSVGSLTEDGTKIIPELFPPSKEEIQRRSLEDQVSDYFEIADKLRNLYPEGRKPGTSYMWRDTTRVIAKKLLTTLRKYKLTPTDEQLIAATKTYIDSFNGDYSYMQLLKYFISKQVIKDGVAEETSQLASYLQNKQSDSQNTEWVTTLK